MVTWIHCPNAEKNGCKYKCKNRGVMSKHLMKCNRGGAPPPSQTFTLSPDVTRWPNTTHRCAKCRGPKARHPETGEEFFACNNWGGEDHLGSPTADAAWEAVQARERTSKTAARDLVAVGRGRAQARGDARFRWTEPKASLGGATPQAELKAWLGENDGWRDAFDRADRLSALALHLVGSAERAEIEKIEAQIALVARADVPKLHGGTKYRQIVESVRTLAPLEDNEFGGVSPLITILVAGTVQSDLSARIQETLRAIKAPHRAAAEGAASRETIRNISYDASSVVSLLGTNLYEAKVRLRSSTEARRRWTDWGFGLKANADGRAILVARLPRILRIADLKAILNRDCDFGLLANLETLFQALMAKIAGERLVGDLFTRTYLREANYQVSDLLPKIGAGDSVALQIKADASTVVEYQINGGVEWHLQARAAAVHFLANYDADVYESQVAADPEEWSRTWLSNTLARNGCGGVVHGLCIGWLVEGNRVGRDPFTDPIERLIAEVVESNEYRIATNVDYDWNRDQPRDFPDLLPDWGGDRVLRRELVATAMPSADHAKRIFDVEFAWRLDAAFATGDKGAVEAALHAAYAAVAHGAKTKGAATYLNDVRNAYVTQHAPAARARLEAADRAIKVFTYRAANLEAGVVATRAVNVSRRGFAHLAHLVSAPATARLPELPGATPSSPERGSVEALTSALAASPANFASSDEDEAPVEKERTRNIGKKSRRRRPLDDAAPAHSTVGSLDAGGLPPVGR